MKQYPRNLHALFFPWCVVVNFVFCITVSVRCTTYIMSWVQLYSEYLRVVDPILASRNLLSALTARSLWHTIFRTDGLFTLTQDIQHWRPVVFDTLCLALAALILSSRYSALAACCLWRSSDELCQKCDQMSVLTLWINGTPLHCGQCSCFFFMMIFVSRLRIAPNSARVTLS